MKPDEAYREALKRIVTIPEGAEIYVNDWSTVKEVEGGAFVDAVVFVPATLLEEQKKEPLNFDAAMGYDL